MTDKHSVAIDSGYKGQFVAPEPVKASNPQKPSIHRDSVVTKKSNKEV